MSRRYTGSEARELAAKATHGPLTAAPMPPGNEYPHATQVLLPSGEDIAWCELYDHVANATLFAAAPDLARTVIALEAERDALRALVVAYGQAHDARTAHSKRAGNGAEMWFAERDELNNAVSDALAALREAAK